MTESTFTRLSAEAGAAAEAGDWKRSAQLWRDAAGELRRQMREIADTRIAGDIVDGVEHEGTNGEEFTALLSAEAGAAAEAGDWKRSAQLWRDAAGELGRQMREIADTRIAGDTDTTSNVRTYTEARHTAYADVSGVAAIEVERREFLPVRVIARYSWRTQTGDTGWRVDGVDVSGPWVDADGKPTGTGSGNLLYPASSAPVWAQQFADANMPTAALVDGGAQ